MYISLVFSNAFRVVSQCNTRLRLLYLLKKRVTSYRGKLEVNSYDWSNPFFYMENEQHTERRSANEERREALSR